MKKGFLNRIFKSLMGAGLRDESDILPPQKSLPVPTLDDYISLQSRLNQKWPEAPFMRVADFMEAYKRHAGTVPGNHKDHPLDHPNVHYFTLLTRFQSRMARGELPFYFPRPGVYNYPEKDLFFAEHCYVAAADVVSQGQALIAGGRDKVSSVFLAALRDVAEQSDMRSGDALEQSGYVFEDGARAPQRYYVSALEMGATFATVLRHRDGGDRARQLSRPPRSAFPK